MAVAVQRPGQRTSAAERILTALQLAKTSKELFAGESEQERIARESAELKLKEEERKARGELNQSEAAQLMASGKFETASKEPFSVKVQTDQGLVDLALKPREDMSKLLKTKLDLANLEKTQLETKRLKEKGTAGQEALDKQFAKDYSEFIAAGGYADTQKNIAQLDRVVDALGNTDLATGPLVGAAPKGLRSITPGLQNSADLQEQVEEVVQRNLRQVLGAQFTEKEGKRLIERAYNPLLQEEINQRRVGALVNQIKNAAAAKLEAAKYFEQNGTLKGFDTSKLPKIQDFYAAIGEKREGGGLTGFVQSSTAKNKGGISQEQVNSVLKQMDRKGKIELLKRLNR